MNMLERCRVAVIGAGIGGVAAALALAQRGASVCVYEQAQSLTEVGAGLQIGPNGTKVLQALGLLDRAMGIAAQPQAAELRNLAGRLVVRLPLADAARRRYGAPYLQFHRADLLALLVDAAKGAGVAFQLGHTAQADPDGTVRSGGDSVRYDVVIAADGVRSGARAAHFAGRPAQFLHHVAWRALVPADGLGADALGDAARVFMGPGRHLVTYPLRGGSILNVVGVQRWHDWVGEGWAQSGKPEQFRAAFAQFGGVVPAVLDRVETCHLWGLFGHPPLASWVNGRLALLGDACHPTLPFLAQGATQAIEDAWVLADSLNAAATTAAGLAAYERRRKRRAEAVAAAARTNGRVYELRPQLARVAAHSALRLAAALSPALLQRRFDWIYGHDVTG